MLGGCHVLGFPHYMREGGTLSHLSQSPFHGDENGETNTISPRDNQLLMVATEGRAEPNLMVTMKSGSNGRWAAAVAGEARSWAGDMILSCAYNGS